MHWTDNLTEKYYWGLSQKTNTVLEDHRFVTHGRSGRANRASVIADSYHFVVYTYMYLLTTDISVIYVHVLNYNKSSCNLYAHSMPPKTTGSITKIM